MHSASAALFIFLYEVNDNQLLSYRVWNSLADKLHGAPAGHANKMCLFRDYCKPFNANGRYANRWASAVNQGSSGGFVCNIFFHRFVYNNATIINHLLSQTKGGFFLNCYFIGVNMQNMQIKLLVIIFWVCYVL